MKKLSVFGWASNILLITVIIIELYFLYYSFIGGSHFERIAAIAAVPLLGLLMIRCIKPIIKLSAMLIVIIGGVYLYQTRGELQLQHIKDAVNSGSKQALFEAVYERTVPMSDEARNYIAQFATPEQKEYIQDLKEAVIKRRHNWDNE